LIISIKKDCKELENNGAISTRQRIWESLNLPKGYRIEKHLAYDPMILFVQSGSFSFKVNGAGVHTVNSQEMVMAQIDNLYEITMLEQTHLIICHVPLEAWYPEQSRIEDLFSATGSLSEKFFKLPVDEMIVRFLCLMEYYLKDGFRDPVFCDIKRQELFFLLFRYYQKSELAQFLQCILSKDIQFKKFVVSNYSHAGNVKELAKLANYSTSGFIKKFRKCFNDSPYKWMQKQKARQISIDINQGVKSLQEIAGEYNFSSYQHFSVFCKAKLGGAPTSIFENPEKKTSEKQKRVKMYVKRVKIYEPVLQK